MFLDHCNKITIERCRIGSTWDSRVEPMRIHRPHPAKLCPNGDLESDRLSLDL